MQDITTLSNGVHIGMWAGVPYKAFPGLEHLAMTGAWCGTPGYQEGGAVVAFLGD